MLPALLALLLSMLFTLFAVNHPTIARWAALPVALVVLVLLIASAANTRRKTPR